MTNSRPPVFPVFPSTHGVVLACHPLAATVGMDMLRQGGNAVDAAIAATWVEMVVLPMATGLGGDVLAMVGPPLPADPVALLGLGHAPFGASRSAAEQRGWRALPRYGLYSASVPRAVDALEMLRERFGRLPRTTLMAGAMHYAEEGFPLSVRGERLFRAAKLEGRANSELFGVLAKEGLPRAGERIRQAELAATLQAVAEHGREGFYHGRFGDALLDYSAQHGGWWSARDLELPGDLWRGPMVSDRETGREWYCPAPSAGIVVAIARALLAAVGPGRAGAEHMTRLARARAAGLALRHHPEIPSLVRDGVPAVKWPEARRWQTFVQTPAPPPPGRDFGGGTSLVAALDRSGWQVAVMHSLSGVDFGAQEMIPGTGVILNSRLGRGASLEAGAANALQPGSVPDSTLSLVAATGGGGRLVGGTPGGDQQSLWDLAALSGWEAGASLADIVAAPRWHDTGDGRTLVSESRLGAALASELASLGWQLEELGPWGNSGGHQWVWSDGQGGYGVGDPRIEGGAAVG